MKLATQRIRYDSQGYSNETFYLKDNTPVRVRLILDSNTFQIINANNNLVLEEGNSKSLAVLKRKAKDKLAKLMGVEFEKEARPVRRGKKIGGLPRKES